LSSLYGKLKQGEKGKVFFYLGLHSEGD